jgi:predicted small lipoprotein YifL
MVILSKYEKRRRKVMKKIMVILIFVISLSGCYSTTPLTFKGDSKNWHIEMIATNDNSNEQQVSATFKYRLC